MQRVLVVCRFAGGEGVDTVFVFWLIRGIGWVRVARGGMLGVGGRGWFVSGLFWCEVGTGLGCEGFLHRPFHPSRVGQWLGLLLLLVAFFDDSAYLFLVTFPLWCDCFCIHFLERVLVLSSSCASLYVSLYYSLLCVPLSLYLYTFCWC